MSSTITRPIITPLSAKQKNSIAFCSPLIQKCATPVWLEISELAVQRSFSASWWTSFLPVRSTKSCNAAMDTRRKLANPPGGTGFQ